MPAPSAPPPGSPVDAGHRSGARARAFATTAVVVAALLTAAVFALVQAADRRDAQARLGTTSREVGLWLALAGACALAGALVLAVRGRATRRVPATALVVATGLAGITGLGSAVAVAATTTGCDAFRFDAARWAHPAGDDEAQALGDAVARCHVVTGLDRAAVRRRLGAPGAPGEGPWSTGSRTWAYGLVLQDAGGLGPTLREVQLLVRFGPDGRATGARVREDVRTY